MCPHIVLHAHTHTRINSQEIVKIRLLLRNTCHIAQLETGKGCQGNPLISSYMIKDSYHSDSQHC